MDNIRQLRHSEFDHATEKKNSHLVRGLSRYRLAPRNNLEGSDPHELGNGRVT
jgi:hypothetical protein